MRLGVPVAGLKVKEVDGALEFVSGEGKVVDVGVAVPQIERVVDQVLWDGSANLTT